MLDRVTENRYLIPLLAAGGVLLGISGLTVGFLPAIGLFAFVIGILGVFFLPVVAILTIVVGVVFIPFWSTLPLLNTASVHIPDLLLAMLILRMIIISQFNLEKNPLNKPIILFCIYGVSSLLIGMVIFSYDAFKALHEFKVVLYYMLAIVVINEVRDRKRLDTLIYGCMIICIVSALFLAYKSFLAPASSEDAPMSVYYRFQPTNTGITVFWCFCCSFCLLSLGRFKWHYLFATLLCGLSLVFTFARHYWIASTFVILLGTFLLMRANQVRVRRIISVLIICLLLVLGAQVSKLGRAGTYWSLIMERVGSLASVEKAGTLEDRLVEFRYAIKKIAASPVWGIGFTRSYRPDLYGVEDRIQWFVHNGYLWILLKTGGIGFGVFVWFSYVFVKRGLRRWRSVEDELSRGIVLGSVISFLGIALANLVVPYFMEDWEVAVIGLSFGINESVYKIEGIEGNQ
jgi:O-antigen ligase